MLHGYGAGGRGGVYGGSCGGRVSVVVGRSARTRGNGCRSCCGALLVQYFLTFPSVYAHSLLIGTLRMEMGDFAEIVCTKTGYSAQIEFHQKVRSVAVADASVVDACIIADVVAVLRRSRHLAARTRSTPSPASSSTTVR